MREFLRGEEVVLIEHYHSHHEGDVWVVNCEYKQDKEVAISNNRKCNLRVPIFHVKHKYPNLPHKHMKEIIEWAKGADIGIVDDDDDENVSSFHCHDPSWFPSAKYVVIEPTPPKTERELKIEELEAKMADIAKQIEELK